MHQTDPRMYPEDSKVSGWWWVLAAHNYHQAFLWYRKDKLELWVSSIYPNQSGRFRADKGEV